MSAALDEDVPAVEEAAADETSVPEEPEPEAPEPVLEEAAYPVRIHVVTGDGEELLEVTVPEGSSVAAALDGGGAAGGSGAGRRGRGGLGRRL